MNNILIIYEIKKMLNIKSPSATETNLALPFRFSL